MSICTHTNKFWAGIVRVCPSCGLSYDKPKPATTEDLDLLQFGRLLHTRPSRSPQETE